MALSLILGEAELTATQMDTTARVTLAHVGRWLGHQRCALGAACQGADAEAATLAELLLSARKFRGEVVSNVLKQSWARRHPTTAA